MTYRGKIQGGIVVLDPQVQLPEGTEVIVEPVAEALNAQPPQAESLADVLTDFAGCMGKGNFPPDGSLQHDHYIYGAAKR